MENFNFQEGKITFVYVNIKYSPWQLRSHIQYRTVRLLPLAT